MRNIPVYKLASIIMNEAIKRANIEAAWVDDVIMGQSYQTEWRVCK
jgi:acetyl-CoA acetyltransferase